MSSDKNVVSPDYRAWLTELKTRFRQIQLKAAVTVNNALLQYYWDLGQEILEKQQHFAWGEGFLKQLSADLMREFPEMKGFSKRNLELIRQWRQYWSSATPIAQQAVSQILSIPWGQNLAIIAKCKPQEEALYYVQNCLTERAYCVVLAGKSFDFGQPTTG